MEMHEMIWWKMAESICVVRVFDCFPQAKSIVASLREVERQRNRVNKKTR